MYLQLGWCGATILAIIVAKIYPRLARRIASDVTLGPVMLAYMVAALNYNHTEAGFRVQSSVWVFFLLGTMSAAVLPKRTGSRLEKDLRAGDESLVSSGLDNVWRDTQPVSRSSGWASPAAEVGGVIRFAGDEYDG